MTLQLSTFQAVLATDGRMSYVLFYYVSVEGLNDDPEFVHFNAGDGGTTFVNPEGIDTSTLVEGSNVGIRGLYIFRVDSKIYSHSILCYNMVLCTWIG